MFSTPIEEGKPSLLAGVAAYLCIKPAGKSLGMECLKRIRYCARCKNSATASGGGSSGQLAGLCFVVCSKRAGACFQSRARSAVLVQSRIYLCPRAAAVFGCTTRSVFVLKKRKVNIRSPRLFAIVPVRELVDSSV